MPKITFGTIRAGECAEFVGTDNSEGETDESATCGYGWSRIGNLTTGACWRSRTTAARNLALGGFSLGDKDHGVVGAVHHSIHPLIPLDLNHAMVYVIIVTWKENLNAFFVSMKPVLVWIALSLQVTIETDFLFWTCNGLYHLQIQAV